MKQISCLLLFVLCSGTYAAQPDSTVNNKPDTTRMNMGNVEILIVTKNNHNDTITNEEITIVTPPGHKATHKKKSYKTRPSFWGGLALGTTFLVNESMQIKVPSSYSYLDLNIPKSITARLELANLNINLSSKKLYLITGLGFEWNNYRFTNHYSLVPDTNMVAAFPSSVAFKKNKLTASYLEVPLLLGYDFNPVKKDKFWIAAGGFAGINLGAHTKQMYRLDGKSFSDKVHDDFNLNPFRYGVTLRAGRKHMALFADYTFSEFFRPGRGPNLYPLTIGIKLF